jgi:hypothetical protein
MAKELRIKRADVGAGQYFLNGKPCCLIGHYLASEGVDPNTSEAATLGEIQKLYPAIDLSWLRYDDDSELSGRLKAEFGRIVDASDSGNPALAIPVFAQHGIKLVLEGL